jgi:hypothetical protein
MTERARKVAVILGAATLAGGAAVGVSAATKPDNQTPGGASAVRQFGPPGAGPRGGGSLSGLAGALGVSESRLQQAMQKIGPPTGGAGPGEMAAALGKELGLPTAKVQSALQSLGPGGGPPPQPPQQQSDVDPPTQLR